MLKTAKKQDPDDDNDLRNYTEIKESYFNEIWEDHGNEDGKLKMTDTSGLKKPKYYVRTEFLAGE